MDKPQALPPCPFCGGEASDAGHHRYSRPLAETWWEDGSEITEAFSVNCMKCGAVSRSGLVNGYQTKAEAIAARHRIAAEERARAEAWQPIETAPKDGTRILLTDGPGEEICWGEWETEWRDSGDMGCNGQFEYDPTHWMPLPAPPAMEPKS